MTEKTQRKRSQARLKRRETKSSSSSSSSGTCVKKNSVPSPKVKESTEVFLARIHSKDSQKLHKFEKSNSWSKTVVRPHRLPHETLPKVTESPAIVQPETKSCGSRRAPKLEPFGKSSCWNKVIPSFPAPRDVHTPAVISLPQVDFPALFPPHARTRGTWTQFQSSQVKAFAQKVLDTQSCLATSMNRPSKPRYQS